MDNTTDLRALIASRHSLLMIPAEDEDRVLRIVARVADQLGLPVWTWSATRGLARLGLDPQYGTTKPEVALQFVDELRAPGVFVFADLHPYLEDPVVLRALKEAAQTAAEGQALVVTGSGLTTPQELGSVARTWHLRPPGDEELADLVDRTLRDVKAMGITVSLDMAARAEMVRALRGLSVAEAERLIQQTAATDGVVTGDDVKAITEAKAELLTVDGILELVEADHGTLAEVGGFERLKDWLAVRDPSRRREAEQLGLAAPRGMLLTGVPGCGKSLVAKTLARSWGRPLVLLDPSRLYSKWMGESESRLDASLRTVEAMAPVVLWIDEIEKGFATGGGDGGVSQRILGSFLRWMQDRGGDVFVVATANDVRSLPPEFLRKGRFDEIFFVDLPDEKARREILAGHLSRRGHDPDSLGVADLAEGTEGFSGAELEAAVVGALYRALSDGGDLRQTQIEAELAATVPLSVSRREEVERLRTWARERAVTA